MGALLLALCGDSLHGVFVFHPVATLRGRKPPREAAVKDYRRETRMKKFFAALFAVALVFLLSACGGEKPEVTDPPQETPGPSDLSGQWKQVNGDSEQSFYGAVVEGEVIEIYWVTDNGDSRSLYWSGTVVPPETADEPYTWESQNDKSRTEHSVLSSSDDTKTFTYQGGQISYSASIMGITSKIRLEKAEWEPGLKVGGDSPKQDPPIESEPVDDNSKFDEETNTKFSIGGVEFSIPQYYEKDEETSNDTNTYFTVNTGDSCMLMSYVADVPKEDFSKKESSLVDDMVELFTTDDTFQDTVLLSSEDIQIAGMSGKRLKFSGMLDNLKAYFSICYLYNTGSEKFVAFTCLQVGNLSYDYLSDLDKIMQSAKIVQIAQESNPPTSGIRPEFKEALDSYEKFFDEYVEFMEKFSASDNTLSMLAEYSDFMTKYAETLSAMEALDDGEMSKEEAAYYLEVTTRINQKLLSAAY